MQGIISKLSNIGGSLGCIIAKFLVITPQQIQEVVLYGLIGSAIGEGVKWGVELIKKKRRK